MRWLKAFFEVDTNRIQLPQVEHDWQSTKGYSREEVDTWVRQLAQVQRLSHERGYSYEDFQRMRSSVDPRERALGTTHHKFYDHGDHGGAANRDHITLSWNGSIYEVSENGRHRVHAAKRNFLATIPAEVAAHEEDMPQCHQHGHRSKLLMPKDRAIPERPTTDTPSLKPGVQLDKPTPVRSIWDRSPGAAPDRKERLER